MFDINHAKFAEGKSAYECGAPVLSIIEAVGATYAKAEALSHRQDQEANKDSKIGVINLDYGKHYRDAEIAGKSLVLGYVEGFVADIRRIANGSRGGGQRA